MTEVRKVMKTPVLPLLHTAPAVRIPSLLYLASEERNQIDHTRIIDLNKYLLKRKE